MAGYESIRHIATSFNGDRFAVAQFEHFVQVWELNTGHVASFTTKLDFGGRRLAITEDGTLLAVASYSPSTLTVFDINKQTELWKRKDIKNSQFINLLSQQHNALFVEPQTQVSQLLDSATGTTTRKLTGASRYTENPYAPLDFIEKLNQVALIDRVSGKTIRQFPKYSFGVLDVCFAPDQALVAYSTGPLQCINLTTLEEVTWAYDLSHFLRVAWNQEINYFLGIRWNYQKGGPNYLSYINPATGNIDHETDPGLSIETEFLKRGTLLLTSQGRLMETKEGKTISSFNFEEHCVIKH